jgi:Kef-type K+ transport system membrane component KefB
VIREDDSTSAIPDWFFTTAWASAWRVVGYWAYPVGVVATVLAWYQWGWLWLLPAAVLQLGAVLWLVVFAVVTRRVAGRVQRRRERYAMYVLLGCWVDLLLVVLLAAVALLYPDRSGPEVVRWLIPVLLVSEVINLRLAWLTRGRRYRRR